MAEETTFQEEREESTIARVVRWVIFGVGGLAILLAIIMAVYRKMA